MSVFEPGSGVHCPLCCLPLVTLVQKKMNARMKDALDETLLLSDKYIFANLHVP